MYYKFKKGEQREIIQKAITKAGSERKLAKLTGIPKGSIYFLKFEKRNLSHNYAIKLVSFLNISIDCLGYSEILPSNWGQIKGGIDLIKKKKQEGVFQETVDRLSKSSSIRMKKWHNDMKAKDLETYHCIQYERFKNVGRNYRIILDNGVAVRNKLERDIGNHLIKGLYDFDYEPYLNFEGKAYFPDFVYKNVIIEVTEWKHPTEEKIDYLNKKIENYSRLGYITCFFIPSRYRKFYKEIKSPVISTLPRLRAFINASVA